ncbi:MAG: glutaminyl-peptide cyclotransferase [Muribaculaceae bacterium]|nr:glutaminyl-peptide cyclotransferase [Muribaculaceae bacterium]
MKKIGFLCIVLSGLCLWSCSKNEPERVEPGFAAKDESLVVVNSGNFTRSNSSLTVWNQETGAYQEAFFNANGFKLGDVAQSATEHDDLLWIVVNNSNIVFAVDKYTFKEKGRIDSGINSPRYIYFVSDDKAYITQMYSDKIVIVNPKTYEVTGYISVSHTGGSDGSTEEMVQVGDYVYVNQWSFGQSILKIDVRTDKEVGEYIVGLEPYSIVKDFQDNIWTICDGGGWSENPIGYEAPSLVELDLHPNTSVSEWDKGRSYELPLGSSVSKLCTNGIRTRLYFILNGQNGEVDNISGVYMIDLTEQYPMPRIVVPAEGRNLYSLAVSPNTEDIFVADVVDYEQNATVYRYSSEGRLIGEFEVGIIPTSYAWIRK